MDESRAQDLERDYAMTDDEILDRWHAAERAHAQASDDDMLEALIARIAAEDGAIARFGFGPHQDAYQARFQAKVRQEP